MKNNHQLHSIIKLRHLKNASQNNWEMLHNTQKMVNRMVTDANIIMENYGDDAAKERFAVDEKNLANKVAKIQELLSDFHLFINGAKTIEVEESFKFFNSLLEETIAIFNTIASYPESSFVRRGANEWSEIWSVIKSNLSIIQGVAESAYIKSLMIEKFNKTEVDTLTNVIVKHIPQSFNLLQADRYKEEYLHAVKEIEQESKAKENLWDRFLNVLAGGIPFQQSPDERVMMRRWLEGERGQL